MRRSPISDRAGAPWLAYRQAVAAGRPRAEVTDALRQPHRRHRAASAGKV